MDHSAHNKIVSFIWSIADDCLRDVFVRGKYRDVILPMFVLRRIDCLLEDTKAAVLEEVRFQKEEAKLPLLDPDGLRHASGQVFYNVSKFTLKTLLGNPSQLVANLTHYLDGFSDNVREIIEKFDLSNQIRKMAEANALFGVIEKFVSSEINLSPNDITAPDGKKLPGLSNLGMGYVFEELMKKPTKPSLPENPAAESLAQRIGERLRRARLMSGHSLRSLAEGIQGVVAHTMLQKYESGEACPDTQVLARLAQTLNLRPDYFSKNSGITLQTVEYRSQTRLGAKARQRLEERAFEFFEPYLEIESILNLPSSAFLQADLSALKADQLGDAIEAAADKLRIPPHEEGFEGFSAFASGYGLRLLVIALTERRLRGTEAGLLEN